MYYSISHITRFRYSEPIKESMMEVRMQPRSEGPQRCLTFQLRTTPRSQISTHRDHLGNTVHHFDVPGQHSQLRITAESLVVVDPPAPLPEALGPEAWDALDALAAGDEHWDWLAPSYFARPSTLLEAFAQEIGFQRDADPLGTLFWLNTQLYERFEYAKQSTRVDSPIDDALQSRKGVCQDFTHIMTTMVRKLGIPCRYVSGYLFQRSEDHDRSGAGATHAWVEALLPGLGWVGFDPTNNLLTGERHIRVAIGRDYADVPPTRGIYKGRATTELTVSVRVLPSEVLPPEEEHLPATGWVAEGGSGQRQEQGEGWQRQEQGGSWQQQGDVQQQPQQQQQSSKTSNRSL